MTQRALDITSGALYTIRMTTTRFEIEYEYHPKGAIPQVSWLYVVTKNEDAARRHFETKMRELGWTKITTLKSIHPPKRYDAPIPTRSPDPDAHKRPSFSATKRKRKNTRATTTSKRRTVSATADTKKPSRNRKVAGKGSTRTSPATKTTKRTGTSRRRTAA